MTASVPPMLTLNNDSAESVQKAALNHFKASAFTSYTEVTPKDSAVLLVLGQKDKQAGEAVALFFFPFFSSCDCLDRVKRGHTETMLSSVFFFFSPLRAETERQTSPSRHHQRPGPDASLHAALRLPRLPLPSGPQLQSAD